MGMKMDLACLALFQRAASESHESLPGRNADASSSGPGAPR